MEVQEVRELIQQTLQDQRYGVYNTIRNEQPHSALVGFATTPDLTQIIIITNKNTRKYINTQLHHKVTLFVSTSKNDPKDLDEAITISAIGTAEVGEKLSPDLIQEYRTYFFEKNPFLEELAGAISDIIVITVDTYEVTKSFHKSVVQTNTDMTSLQVRQLPGVGVVPGHVRGKVVKIKSLAELEQKHENSIIAIDTIADTENFSDFKGKGLVIANPLIPTHIEDELKKSNIPTVKSIKLFELLTTNKDITVNGSLGLIIFHEIKK